jgi:SnoaL-like polyketide cyclase
MSGYDDQYVDIVDYIVRITEEIWRDLAIGRIYETYDAHCTVYGATGVVRSVEEVVAATIAAIDGYPDSTTDHINVAWRGDDVSGFYTSHLGYSGGVNLGPSGYGTATGKRVMSFFVADCISRENRIHTEWLMHDTSAVLQQLGLDLHETARIMADAPPADWRMISPPTRLDGQAPRRWLNMPNDTPDGWAHHHFNEVWNARRLEHVRFHYAADAVGHWPGGRVANGPGEIAKLIISLLASLPDSTVSVQHVSWSDETDGVILAVRWLLEGTTRAGAFFGHVPGGKPVAIMGSTHFRFGGGYVVEEWTVFDELAVLTKAYQS